MEDKEEGLFLSVELALGIDLMLVEELGMETNVSGLVDTVDIAKRRSNGEVGADLREGRVNVPNVFRLCVEARVVDAGVVYAILFAAGDADLHLEPETKGSHALEVLDASGDVFLLGLF